MTEASVCKCNSDRTRITLGRTYRERPANERDCSIQTKLHYYETRHLYSSYRVPIEPPSTIYSLWLLAFNIQVI